MNIVAMNMAPMIVRMSFRVDLQRGTGQLSDAAV